MIICAQKGHNRPECSLSELYEAEFTLNTTMWRVVNFPKIDEYVLPGWL